MGVRIDVWSDFVCPWCFLAATTLDQLQAAHDVQIFRHAFELRPRGAPPMPPEYRDYIEKVAHPQFIAMAREQYGIEIHAGPVGIDSRKALIGAKYAESQGVGPAYHDAVFRAYWQQARAIDDPAVLCAIAAAIGLDTVDFRAALDASELNVAVSLDLVQARRYGLTEVPAMVFENQYLVSGAEPYHVLRDVVLRLQKEKTVP